MAKKTIKKNNIDYVIAIPTYKRYNEITTKTLPTLKKGKLIRNVFMYL